jgi:hypothetical protein
MRNSDATLTKHHHYQIVTLILEMSLSDIGNVGEIAWALFLLEMCCFLATINHDVAALRR